MKRTVLFAALLTAGAALLGPRTAEAQVFTPSYMAPVSGSDLGVYLSEGIAVEGILRRAAGGFDYGLRAGVFETHGVTAILVGGEYRNPLALGSEPLKLAATAGIQGAFGDASVLGLNGGLTIGATFHPEGITITPYLHPRLAYTNWLNHDHPVDQHDHTGHDSSLDLQADLGADFEFGGNLILRIGLGFAHGGSDFGVGLAWR